MRDVVFTSLDVEADANSLVVANVEQRLLGAVCFGSSIRTGTGDIPAIDVSMKLLHGARPPNEAWHALGPVQQGQFCLRSTPYVIRFRHDEELLFGAIEMAEEHLTAGMTDTPLQRCTRAAYDGMLDLIHERGFSHLYRIWNYLSDINGVSFGMERYRQFNLGREAAHAAHASQGFNTVQAFPSACALGSAAGPLDIAFIAGRKLPQRVENPRQISAYHYPDQYGPRKPLFSRATRVQIRGCDVLFISGTASVVGHATLHAGDVAAQTRESVANIKAILIEVNRTTNGANATEVPPFGLLDLVMRVYVRRPQDLPVVQMQLQQLCGATPNAVYLQADICRSDLLVEIEAHAVGAATDGAH